MPLGSPFIFIQSEGLVRYQVARLVFLLMPLGWFAQRANQTTTRYAGVRKKLYKKIPLSSTIRLFKS